MNGATVTTRVAEPMHGEFLRRMEHHADIHLLLRRYDRINRTWTWWMRSDRWPDWMEGAEMIAECHGDRPGLTFEPILSCDLHIHEIVKRAFAKAGIV